MLQINKIVIAGALGADPEMRAMPNGDAVCNLRVATTEKWKDKATGEAREATEWHRVVFRRKQAETIGQYFKKGSAIYIEGKLKTRKWQDKEGKDNYITEIEGDTFQFPGSSKSDGASSTSQPAAPARSSTPRQAPAQKSPMPFDMDDMPAF